MATDTYFQFPLCALSFGQTIEQKLDAIIDYSLTTAGMKLWCKLTQEQQHQFIAEQLHLQNIPKGFNQDNPLHCATLYGSHIIGINLNGFLSGIERHLNLQRYIREFESRHGRDVQVRIRKSWLFKVRDRRGITHREFAVLCAIYSAIGDKDLTIITLDRIQRCALGYRKAAIMKAELSRRLDRAKPLTEHPLRDTIARLHHNKFFARSTFGLRITYYSIRLNGEELRKKILELRTYARFFHATQTTQDQALTDAIRQRRRELASSATKTPSRAL